jgi:hypothetical protein
MRLKTVTLTGADDSVHPRDLRLLSKQYPFLEWGILVSLKQEASPRFPSTKWMQELALLASHSTVPLNISAHICGSVLRDLLMGDNTVFLHYGPLLSVAQRIQLNFHGEPQRFNPRMFAEVLNNRRVDVIFQHDGVNDVLMEKIMPFLGGDRCVPFYDMSHGAGVYPKTWPSPNVGAKMYGFAGGIGPENVLTAIKEIGMHVAESVTTWIDMETNIRTGARFDLVKCLAVARSCEPLIWRKSNDVAHHQTS